jgi:hypothetical protein
MIDEGDCGAIGGMKIGRGNRSTGRKPAPAPSSAFYIFIFKRQAGDKYGKMEKHAFHHTALKLINRSIHYWTQGSEVSITVF